MRDALVLGMIALHERKRQRIRRQRKAKELADLTTAGRLRAMGHDPEEWVIGMNDICRILNVPERTVRRWIRSNLWGLGDGTLQVGRAVASRREALAGAVAAMHRQREEAHARRRPEPPIPIIHSALSALIAAVDSSDEPVTLHQVTVATGGAYEPKELAAAALKAVRSRQLERTQVPSPSGLGRAHVWAYSPGPNFEVAKRRRPRLIARLKRDIYAPA